MNPRHHLLCALLVICVAGLCSRPGKGQQPPPLPGVPPTITLVTPAPGPVPQTPQFSRNPTDGEFFRVRVFEEPLVPLGASLPVAQENRALADALLAFAQRTQSDDYSSLVQFLAQHQDSRWAPSLLTVLGLEFYHTGYFSKALDCWQKAWDQAKDLEDPQAGRIADRAFGELVKMQARIGRYEILDGLLAEAKGRRFTGTATEWVAGAKQAVWAMHNTPQIAFRCGPFALRSILEASGSAGPNASLIESSSSSPQGFSLAQVWDLSERLHMNLQIASRDPGSDIIVPAVIHWKVGHFAAIIRTDADRYVVVDPTFGNSFWLTKAALDSEASGAFLVPAGTLPQGWSPLTRTAASEIWGRGTTTANDPDATTPYDLKGEEACALPGMAAFNMHLMDVSLNIEDTPISFSPPQGPRISFTMTYNQREANQPTTFTYSNFGNKWTHNWLSYIVDSGGTNSADVQSYVQGGGTETYTGFNTTNSTYTIQWRNQTSLKRNSSTNYELTFPDGSKNIYGQPDGTVGASRKVFLTAVIDPAAYTNLLWYDPILRLVMVTDPQLSRTNLTFSYSDGSSLPDNTNTIRSVADYYGRHADFSYDLTGSQLQVSKDVLGLRSTFAYAGGDFINSLKTPYGTNSFAFGEEGRIRWLETTDPAGGRTRTEFNEASNLGVPDSDPGTTVPLGMYLRNEILYARNTFYWDKHAMHDAPGDYSKARIYHWLHSSDMTAAIGALESFKEPFERRVWFNYPGQSNSAAATVPGTCSLPNLIGRVLDDGTEQFFELDRNSIGKVTNAIDPIGRTFTFDYATNGIDLLRVRQTRFGSNNLLAAFTYNSQHLPINYTNVSGQVTQYGYNQYGQLTALTNALSQVTTLSYDAVGHLQSIITPLPGGTATNSFAYDSFDRVRTTTTPDGYSVTADYDAFDRPLTNTFPDGTKEIFAYNRLDPASVTDRAGRITQFNFNGARQLTQVQQMTNWVTRLGWCSCGHLLSLTDPNGATVSWTYDTQGRLKSKSFLDGSSIQYSYESTTSRLKSVTNERGTAKTFAYNADNTVSGISYSDGTPAITLTYDLLYYWLGRVQDGTGGTTNLYNAITVPPALDSGRLTTIDGPLANDSVTFSHDALGRVTKRAVNGTSQTFTFDAAGRLSNLTNALGGFTVAYSTPTPRPASISFPNGQSNVFAYFGTNGDNRIQEIKHLDKTSAVISKFDYIYTPVGQITNWTQQSQSQTSIVWTLSSDALGQLTNVVVTSNSVTIQTYNYAYDLSGNRILEQVGTGTNRSWYNSLNQLIGQDQPATFSARTCEWDGENRLTAVNIGTNRSEFTYDSAGRMARLVEKVPVSVVADRRFVWIGAEMVEERDSTGTNVVKRFFAHGYQKTGTNYYYTRDHLGSVRDVCDSATVRKATMAYDPFGRQTFPSLATGFAKPDFGFSDHFQHFTSGFVLAMYRAYDPNIGRWQSRDPIGEAGGVNLYAYVLNDPVNLVDPFGLACGGSGGESGEGASREREGRLRDSLGNLIRDQVNPLGAGNLGPENISTGIGLSQGSTTRGAAETTAGKTIGLGLDRDLANHIGTRAITYENGAWQNAGLTSVPWWKAWGNNSTFMESFREAAKNAAAIRFDVTTFNPAYPKPGLTQMELTHILNPAENLLGKTTFIQNGRQVFWNGTKFVRP